MPGFLKRVRFSRSNTVVSPPTPALSIGSFSPESSVGIITPPQHIPSHLPQPSRGGGAKPGPTPYMPVPTSNEYHGYLPHQHHQPQQHPTPRRVRSKSLDLRAAAAPRVYVHRYLESPGSSGHPAVHYDLVDHPSAASRHQQSISSYTLGDPATNPPLPEITLKSESLPWYIRIVPASSRRSYVTVGDVLDQLYATLRGNITQADWDVLNMNERKNVNWAYEARYRRLRGYEGYDKEKASGVKRVDYLLGHSRFLGLSRTRDHNVWVLNTG